MKTPVVFMIFNRPDTTQKVFEAIRQAQPPLLFVIADGPRPNKPGEDQKCAATRAIIEQVDWDCEVLTNYSEINLGCERRVSSGLDWVFDTVEEAIILEDDCLPHPTFFSFCEELLDYYRNDQRVMAITGQNVQFGQKRTDYTYYFSRYNHCWGWASWRRAWRSYDPHMTLWPEFRDKNILIDILIDAHAAKVWKHTFQLSYEGKLKSWAFKWTFACWVQGGLSIIPNVNIISNLGHGSDATNTQDKISPYSNMPVEAIEFPIKHPPFIVRHLEADTFTENTLFDYHPRFWKKVRYKIRDIIQTSQVQLGLIKSS